MQYPNFEQVKALLIEDKKLSVKLNTLYLLGIEVNKFLSIELFDLALDIVGFPKDNSLAFGIQQRQDEETLFNRDWLSNAFFELKLEDINDDYIKTLYHELEELKKEDPQLFLKTI